MSMISPFQPLNDHYPYQKQAYLYLYGLGLHSCGNEHLHLMILTPHRVINAKDTAISSGEYDFLEIDDEKLILTIEKLKPLLKKYPESKLILAHNHPSQNPDPSDADIKTHDYEKLYFDGLLFDEIIFTKDHIYSFKHKQIFSVKIGE